MVVLKQYVDLSTIKVEYIAITEGCKETLWMKNFSHELGVKRESYVVCYKNQSAIHLIKNLTYHSNPSILNWIRDVFENKQL